MRSKATLSADLAPHVRGLRPLGPVLRAAARKAVLSTAERRALIDQLVRLLGGYYVHLPLKRAAHGADPVRRLELLRLRADALDEARFHEALVEIVTDLRDRHVTYVIPGPLQPTVAVLPFRVEEYHEGGDRRFMATRVRFPHARFRDGTEILAWNGVPIARAAARAAARTPGCTPAARAALGLKLLTTRPLAVMPPPDETWVQVTYREGRREREIRAEWCALTLTEEEIGEALLSGEIGAVPRAALGLDPSGWLAQRAHKRLFAGRAPGAPARPPIAWIEPAEQGALPSVVSSGVAHTPRGAFAYLRLWSFQIGDASLLLDEVVRVLERAPGSGLILDLRGNPGGYVTAGEMLLQTLTPRPITPSRFHLRSTPETLALSAKAGSLRPWHASLAEAASTGATYSRGRPIEHDDEAFNRVGQVYHGPVLLLTDALMYSTADIVAAGFRDHGIGPILGVADNIGAGGGNAWDDDYLRAHLPRSAAAALPKLPGGAALTLPIRCSMRVGASAGMLLEELGLAPDHVHRLTARDVLGQNEDLLARAGEILAALPARALSATKVPGQRLRITARGIDRCDLWIGGRPTLSAEIPSSGAAELALPRARGQVVLRGFERGALVAERRLRVPGAGEGD